MTPPMQADICIDRSQRLLLGTQVLFAFGGIATFSVDFLRERWLPIALGYGAVMAILILPASSCICFRAERKVLEISYPLGGILRRNETYPFVHIAAIQSFPRISGESDPEVALEIVLQDGSSKIIDTAPSEWALHAKTIGLAGCIEPQRITTLRRRIADLVGMENRGFLGGVAP